MINNNEVVKYYAYVDSSFVEVVYLQDKNMLIVEVGDYGVTDYAIELNDKTRKIPDFKRFNNKIRARIGTGIFICSQTPGYALNLHLAQAGYPNPWWRQRSIDD